MLPRQSSSRKASCPAQHTVNILVVFLGCWFLGSSWPFLPLLEVSFILCMCLICHYPRADNLRLAWSDRSPVSRKTGRAVWKSLSEIFSWWHHNVNVTVYSENTWTNTYTWALADNSALDITKYKYVAPDNSPENWPVWVRQYTRTSFSDQRWLCVDRRLTQFMRRPCA